MRRQAEKKKKRKGHVTNYVTSQTKLDPLLEKTRFCMLQTVLRFQLKQERFLSFACYKMWPLMLMELHVANEMIRSNSDMRQYD
jgi:hypothetical protein